MAGKAPDAILVAIDFSPPSLRALDAALGWVAPGAEVTAVHVVDSALARRLEATGLCPYAEAVARLRQRAEREFAALAADRPGCFSPMVVEGVPFVEIVKVANDLDCGLIVIGARSHSADLEQVLFGSTAEKVLRAARRPVLCVP